MPFGKGTAEPDFDLALFVNVGRIVEMCDNESLIFVANPPVLAMHGS